MTTARRKYRFPDRAAAEEAFLKADAESVELSRALTAIFRDEVHWLPQTGGFLVGVFWLHKGNGHVIVRQPRTDATPRVLDVDEFTEWADGKDGYGAGYSIPALRTLANWVRLVRQRVLDSNNEDANADAKAAIRDVCRG